MAAGPSSGPQKKSQRPTLSSHLAHAHAFATIPTPGNPSSARTANSYFPLPTPPAPLRSFALAQNGDLAKGTNDQGTNTYPTSISSQRLVEKCSKEVRPSSLDPKSRERKGPRRSSRTDPNTKAHTHSSASISGNTFQFASASPFVANTAKSPYASPGGRSGRSALSIAEIDCFFVQGSRSSTYSAQSRSPPSQPATGQSDHSTASLSEVGISSNEEGDPERWAVDHAERERQRTERQAFMRERKEMREELRRKKRLSRGVVTEELSPQAKSTWREAIKLQGTIPLNEVVPKLRESVRKRAGTASVPSPDGTPLGETKTPTATGEATKLQTPPSGPGPPKQVMSESTSIDSLANDLATNLSLSTLPSEILEDPNAEDTTLGKGAENPSGTPPLSRFDSDETEVGNSSQQSQT